MPDRLPVPECSEVFGHEQCPKDWNTQDKRLEEITDGTELGALIRLVGGFNKSTGKWSRTSRSYQVWKSLALGFAHMFGGNAGDILQDLATKQPEIAKEAFGAVRASELAKNPSTALAEFSGRSTQPKSMNWLSAGWAHAIANPKAIAVYIDRWYEEFVSPMIAAMKKRGWTDGRTLAALVRMRNTSGTAAQRMLDLSDDMSETEARVRGLEIYDSDKTTRKVNGWEEFRVDHSSIPWPSVADLGSRLNRTGGFFSARTLGRSFLPAIAIGSVLIGGILAIYRWRYAR